MYQYTEIINNETSDCPGGSVSFVSDTNAWVFPVFDGELVASGKVDSGSYFMVLRFGDYYVVYDHIKKIYFDNGYFFSQGRPIGQAYDNGEEKVVVTITLIKDGVSLPIYDWFRNLPPSIEKIIFPPPFKSKN